MAKKYDILNHCSIELKKIKDEITQFKETNEYMYSNVMQNYAKRYNDILIKYYKQTGLPLEKYQIFDYEYSSTHKTVRDAALQRYLLNIDSSKRAVDELAETERIQEYKNDIPFHQMRKCLKTGVNGCPKNPKLIKNKVFIGMPFDKRYLDSYEYGLKFGLQACGMESFRADEKINNSDVMCKICEQMQSCQYLVFNISGLNPNVMLELGLSYGLGKETLIVKDVDTKPISDIASTEYIEYSHAAELQKKIVKYFESR